MGNLKEDLILSTIIKNNYFRDKVIQHIRPEFFEEAENGKLYEAIQELVNKDNVKQLDSKTISLKYKEESVIKSLFDLEDYPNENIHFLLKEAEEWGKEQSLKQAVISSVDIISEKKDTAKVGSLIHDALGFSFDKDLGHNYLKDIHNRFLVYNNVDETLPTGFEMFDMFTNGGLHKKTLTVIAGSSGLGKTLLGTNLTAFLIQGGYSGAYITLEMRVEEIARRMDALISKIPHSRVPNEEKTVTNELNNKVKGKLFIREYLPSKACCANIMGYVHDLQRIEGFKFDFLVVDYIQLMKPNYTSQATNSYEKYKMISEELREMGTELNIPMISFSQVQRAGYGNPNLGMSNISDSMGIVNTSDLMVGMTQSLEEEEELKQTWRLIKNRFGRKGVELRVQMDEEILAFKQIINDEERAKLNNFKNRKHLVVAQPTIKEESLAMLENEKKDNPIEVEKEFEKFVEENDKPESFYRGFS